MKKIYILVLFSLWSILSCSADDSTAVVKKFQKIILDNTPLKAEEKLDKKNTPKLKEFIKYISPQEMENQKVLFYDLEDNYDINPLLPRFVKYMMEDGNIIKIHTVKNIMAIMVNENFDQQNFEQNAKNINLLITKSSKEAFLKL